MLHLSGSLLVTILDTLLSSLLPAMVSTTSKELPKLIPSFPPPGLPLLYIGGLTVPLGFARSEEIRKSQNYDYGYEEA